MSQSKESLTKSMKQTKQERYQERYRRELTLRFLFTQIITSSIANTVATVAGHPLDTIKIRMQLDTQKSTVVQAFQNIVKQEGFRGLYKGIMSPIVGSAPCGTIIFTATELSKRVLIQYEVPELTNNFISGMIAGTLSMSFFVPIELVKCRSQMSKDRFINYREDLRMIVRQEGIKGLYKGFWATFWRDVPSWGVFFYVFEVLKQNFAYLTNKDDANIFLKMIAGGSAGVCSWLSNYPFDIVKTHIQCNQEGTLKIAEVFKHYYTLYGYQYFFKGLVPTLLRSFPVSAISLSTFDTVNKYLQ